MAIEISFELPPKSLLDASAPIMAPTREPIDPPIKPQMIADKPQAIPPIVHFRTVV